MFEMKRDSSQVPPYFDCAGHEFAKGLRVQLAEEFDTDIDTIYLDSEALKSLDGTVSKTVQFVI